MRSAVVAALLVLGILALPTRPARADDEAAKVSYRAVIDRADLEPSTLVGDRLRIYLSALSIDGHRLDLTDPKSIRLMIGSSEMKAPYSLGTFGATDAETAIVFVVETTQVYADILPVIQEALDGVLLNDLKDGTTQVSVLGYGDGIGGGKFGSIKQARAKLAALANDGSVADPAMLDTLEYALSTLKRVKTLRGKALARDATDDAPIYERPIRKIIVLVGDGRDRAADRERVTRIGLRAAKENVRIHTLAFSPTDTRKPLLALGELSKRSLGTFRWIRGAKADSWRPVVQQLSDEILKQNVLTYYLPADADVGGKKLKIITVGRTEATSNEIKIPASMCGGVACEAGAYCANDHCTMPAKDQGRGVLGWALILIGIAVGGLVILGVISYAITKRSPSIPLPPGVTMPPGAVAPVVGAIPARAGKKPKAPKPPKGMPVPPPAPPPPAHPPRTLFILNGPRAGERLALKNGFVIGKAPDSDFVNDDGFTSGRHAIVTIDPAGNTTLVDHNSTNGTMVNGVRITSMILAPGVIVQIGNTQLRFLAE